MTGIGSAIDLGLRLDLIIFWWIAGVSVVLTIVLAALGVWRGYGDWLDSGFSFASLGTGFVAVFFVGALVVAYIPFQERYWHLYAVSGEVAAVEATFNVDDGNITNNYIVTLEGDGTPYRVTDPRIKNAVGVVDLTCSLEWVYQGADRVNCDIRSLTGGAR